MDNLLLEKFKFDNLDRDKQRKVYDIFKQSYEKATGTSWDEHKFRNRADNWLFFGDENGFVTVRPQNGGFYKLTGIAGGIKSILKGLTELQSMNVPVWGMMTTELANILVKRYGYRKPYNLEAKIIMKSIPKSAFGNVDYKMNNDGSVTFSYTDVGEATKFFVANKLYYTKVRILLLKMAKDKFLSPFKKKKIDEEDIDEARAVKETHETALQAIDRFIKNYGYENTYISFRGTVNATEKNLHNSYNTPTGIYCYPLISYKDRIEGKKTIREFTKQFPYQNDKQYMHTFSIRDYSNVLFTSKNETEKMNRYAETVKRVYSNNENIIKLCDQYIKGEFHGKFEGYNAFNPTHNFWLFLYKVEEIDTGRNDHLGNDVSNLCLKIRIDGFIDDLCSKSIHEAEPCQAVFFRLKGIVLNYEVIDAWADRNDVPVKIQTTPRHVTDYKWDVETNSAVPHREKDLGKKYGDEETIGKDSSNFRKYLSKLRNTHIVALDPDYRKKIKQNSAFWVGEQDKNGNDIIAFIDEKGNPSIKGIDVNNIKDNDNYNDNFSSDQIRAAYFNALTKRNDFVSVIDFGYGLGNADRAIATFRTKNGQEVQRIINKEGKPTISGIDLKNVDSPNEILAIFYNQRLKLPFDKMFSSVSPFGTFTENPNFAYAVLLNGESAIINKKGQKDITGLDPFKITKYKPLAAYFNQKLGKDEFESVTPRSYDYITDGKHFYAQKHNGQRTIIDETGADNISDINVDDIYNNDALAAYFNVKLKTNEFTSIYPFNGERIKNTDYSIAEFKSIYPRIINRNGEPDVTNLNPNDIASDRERRIYFINKTGENKFERVGKFGEGVGDPNRALAITNNDKTVVIDIDGNENYEGLDITKISSGDANELRAVILNGKLKENLFSEIYEFGEYTKNPERAVAVLKNSANNYAFIDKEGNLDTSDIDPREITNIDILTAYFSQKLGERKFRTVYEFGGKTGNEDRALAVYRNDPDNMTIIDTNGNENFTDIKINALPSNVRLKMINDILGDDVYKEVGMFTTEYSNEERARAVDKKDEIVIINKEGKPDVTNVDPDKIDNVGMLTAYFNQKIGEKKFQYVKPFNGRSATVAALKPYDIPLFINKEGERINISENPIDIDIYDGRELAIYYNSLLGEDLFRTVSPFGEKIDSEEYTTGFTKDGDIIIINKKGEKATGGLDPDNISDVKDRAIYINQIIGKDEYKSVGRYGYKTGNENIAIAKTEDDAQIFINKDGEPDITGLDPKDIEGGTLLATYYNTLLGDSNPMGKFTDIMDFGEYTKNPDRAIAITSNGKTVIINKKGEPDLSGVDVNYLLNSGSGMRALYFNQLVGKDIFKEIKQFGTMSQNPNLAIALHKDGYRDIINKEGISDITGITPEDVYNDYNHVFINHKLGKNVYSKVHQRGSHVGSPNHSLGIVHLPDKKDDEVNKFRIINDEGIPDIDGVDLEKINNDTVRAAYFNQLVGKNIFESVDSFGSVDISNAYLLSPLNGSKVVNINKKGEIVDNKVDEKYQKTLNQILAEETNRAYTQYLINKLLEPQQ